MKLTYTSVSSYLRVAVAGTLVVAAVALGVAAVKTARLPLSGKSGTKSTAPNKFRKDFDAGYSNKMAVPGPTSERGPLAAALEDFAHRAYPLDDVPTEASLNAISGFNHFVATTAGVGNGKKTVGAWHLIGPSNAVDPSILTF